MRSIARPFVLPGFRQERPMTAEQPEWIRDVLSTPRFASYLAASDSDVGTAISLYWWNVEVSAALYIPLHCLELALRNAMHAQLCSWLGRADWWVQAPLDNNGRLAVSTAEERLLRRPGRRYTADDVVAKLTFGFWVSLLSRGYDRELWVPALHRAFPYFTRRRQELHADLLDVLDLRNRIMHYEPVHRRDLWRDHAKLHRLLGYISPRMVKELQARDRVGEVLRSRNAGSTPGGGAAR
jgi:hypothetical protein